MLGQRRFDSVTGAGWTDADGLRWGAGLLAILLLMTSLFAVTVSGADMKKTASGLAYLTEGRGPALVLIHGSNLDHRMWEDEAGKWSRRFQVIRYDLRGHGQSAIPQEPFLAAQDLLGLLDELKIDKAVLVGLSAGAQIAIDFALEHPQRVERMVLAAPGLGGYRPSEMPALFKPLMEALQAHDFEQANEVLLNSSLLRVPPEKSDLVASMVRSNLPLWSIPPQIVEQLDPPAISRLGELEMPILVMVGDQDLPHIQEQADLITGGAKNARLVVVSGGGHLLNLTSPGPFGRFVTEFLQTPRP